MLTNPFKDTEDKLRFAKAADRFTAAEKTGRAAFTDFLDPVRCAMFSAHWAKQTGPIVQAFGGFADAERKMLGFFPSFSPPEDGAFPITAVAVTFNAKYAKPPGHRDYLGAILGLGLERGKIGDICLTEKDAGATVYVAAEIAELITQTLAEVGRTPVKATFSAPVDAPDMPDTPESPGAGTPLRVTVPSLRLDAVVGAAYRLSRSKAADLIDAEKVFVNWKLVKRTYLVAPGDVLTVRGMGRVTVDALDGTTKKERVAVRMTRYG